MLEVYFRSLNSDIVLWTVRSFYIVASYAILIVRFIPDLRHRFLDYGARSNNMGRKSNVESSALPRWLRTQIGPFLDMAASKSVPHSWFSHFYVVCTVCTAGWAAVVLQGPEPQLLSPNWEISNMWESRTKLCMFLMQIQGLRRLYECLFMSKPSKSRMWIGHYFIGIAFYLVTNVALWIEPALHHPEGETKKHGIGTAESLFEIMRTLTCLSLFVHFSIKQHRVHKYLASLQEYRVPDHSIYQETNLICPHYGFEVNIYLIFSVLVARDLRILNVTMLCATFFVVVNLGVTADLTKKWLMEKFPKQRPEIAKRKKMLGSIW